MGLLNKLSFLFYLLTLFVFMYLCIESLDITIMSIISLFDKDVTLNAVLYILEKMGGRADMHKIFKTLYIADQFHLSKYGRTITGDVYIAMEFGPVPSKTDDIFKSIRGDSYFKAGELIKYLHFVNRYIVEPSMKSNTDYLSDTDIECLDKAIERCKNKTFAELTRMTHDFAYQNTKRDRAMSFKDILREIGETEEYVDYISEKMNLESSFCG